MNIIYITIGDWSDDGHGNYNAYAFNANHTVAEMQAAYRASVNLTGLRFHNSQGRDNPNAICTDYREHRVLPFHIEILRRYGDIDCTPFGDEGYAGFRTEPIKFATFIIWFIGLSLPGLKYDSLRSIASNHKSGANYIIMENALNGWWGSLNHQFGYGIYDGGTWSPANLRRCPRDHLYWNALHSNGSDLPEYEVRTNLNMSGYGPSSVEAVKEWIDQNCKHQVARAENRFFFEDQAEASMFKLIWETLG